MTYNQITQSFYSTIPVFVEFYEKQVLKLRKSQPKGIEIWVAPAGLSDHATTYLQVLDTQSFMMKLETYLAMESLGDGPKVFRPTSEQMFALEKMRLNIEVSDFAAPYKMFTIELPDEYKAARNPKAHCSQLFFDSKLKVFVHNVLEAGSALKTWWAPEANDLIEEWFENDYHEDYRIADLPVEEQEQAAEILIRRAALNYCLLLDEVGTKRVGPASPNAYTQLVKWCEKKNHHTPRNKAHLKAQPIVYALKAPTELVRVVSEIPPSEGETGRSVSPHSRRGYYRMNPCGPKGQDRKRVRIPPCFVNLHKLIGGKPGAEYRT